VQPLTGKRVLVTGASAGIGGATARLFAEKGATVVATARSADALAALAGALPKGAVTPVAGDLTDRGFLADLVATAEPVDVLVNNAGALKHAPFLEADPADWGRIFEINVLALLKLTQPIARGMAERRVGHIINVSSLLARRVAPFTLVYAATKHAVAAITQGLRTELGPFGVRVTEIAPGIVDTGVFGAIDDPRVRPLYANPGFERLSATQVATAIVSAAGADANVCPDLLELRAVGQA